MLSFAAVALALSAAVAPAPFQDAEDVRALAERFSEPYGTADHAIDDQIPAEDRLDDPQLPGRPAGPASRPPSMRSGLPSPTRT